MALFNFNRFHLMVALTWQFAIFFATQMLMPIFSGYVPRWRCNSTIPASISTAGEFAKNCTIYEQCNGNIEFEYNYFLSSALEFDWVCGNKAYIGSLFAQIQFAGVLIGTLLFGSLSDCFGRKPVSLFVLSFGISMMVCSALSPYWQLLLASRFFIGLSIGGTVVVVCTFVMEMLLPEQRMALRAFFNWGVARLLLTGLCYIFPDWRKATMACAVCCLPTLLIIIFVFPESPTWLHSKGRLEQMRSNERKIAAFVGEKYVEVQHEPIVETQSFKELVRNKALFKRISVLWIMWFIAALCGYAIDLNSSNIVGNLFLNQALFGILIALSKVMLVIFDTLLPSFSRRNLHQYSQFIVVVSFLVLTLLVLLNQQGSSILVVNLVGTVFIEYTWDACYLCGVEAMPTSMRATSMGSCSLVARIGAILAPSLAFLNLFWAPSAYLTVVVLGLINLIVSYKWLVETKGVNLDRVKLREEQGEDSTHLPHTPGLGVQEKTI